MLAALAVGCAITASAAPVDEAIEMIGGAD